ncbi:hypothetical protein Barb7_02425 [Bacteroidales bacterium Barb7]|nr:hypothetical protein Barb7_02425 [Bacteroidales bacterium Barb7]
MEQSGYCFHQLTGGRDLEIQYIYEPLTEFETLLGVNFFRRRNDFVRKCVFNNKFL